VRTAPVTASCRWSTFRSVLALTIAIGLSASARSARAQACCASAGLVAPTRLRAYEDFAAGLQGRGRSIMGAFGAGGGYAGNGVGNSEWDFEQDLFGVARVLGRGQMSLLIPFIETRQAIAGSGDAGGGIGDIVVSARYDFLNAGERRSIPGLALLLGLVVPTGTPLESAATPAGMTGQGTYQGSVGFAVEQAYEPYFVTVNVLGTLHTSRNVSGVHESFAPALTGIASGGRVLPHGATVGAFFSAMKQGDNSEDGARISDSDLLLLTAGLAGTFALSDEWRLQSTAYGELPFGGLGRNEKAGIGASLSVMKLWL
jgi:hypothetical protein